MSVVNAIVQGVFLGGLYALFACGLSLMFGVMRIINLAHGDISVLGAFGVWVHLDRARHLAVPGPGHRDPARPRRRLRVAGDPARPEPAFG